MIKFMQYYAKIIKIFEIILLHQKHHYDESIVIIIMVEVEVNIMLHEVECQTTVIMIICQNIQ